MATNNVLTSCCTTHATNSDKQAHAVSDSCCTTSSEPTDATAIDGVRSHASTPELAAIRSVVFRRLLDHDRAVTRAEVAAATGLDETTIATVIEGNAGPVELDTDGSIVGIAGLTINPTPHQVVINDKTRWTWCALDAVGILGALGATGSIHSTDPATGKQIDISFLEGTPDTDATLFILSGYDGANARGDWCPLVNFFATRVDAESWVSDKGLQGDIVSVAEIAKDATAMWQLVAQIT